MEKSTKGKKKAIDQELDINQDVKAKKKTKNNNKNNIDKKDVDKKTTKSSVSKDKLVKKTEDLKTTSNIFSKTETKQFKQGTLEKFNVKIAEKPLASQSNDIMIDMPDDAKVRIFSWNVNGLRSFKGKGTLDELIKKESPDIICFNETKIDAEKLFSEKVNLIHSDKYGSYWNCCKQKKGYSGVAILTKYKPLSVIYDIGVAEHDLEGRVITLEFPLFYIVCVYVPNSGEGLKRLSYRLNDWDKCFQKFLLDLSSKKNLILTGDLNVAHKEIDLYNPKAFIRHAGFTIEERESFSKFLVEGFVDTFRALHPDEQKFSYFSNLGGLKALKENRGWRLDYFVVNDSAMWNVEESDILVEYGGSDHRPIKLVYDLAKKAKTKQD